MGDVFEFSPIKVILFMDTELSFSLLSEEIVICVSSVKLFNAGMSLF